jgi:hypothetical protein
VDIPAAAAGWVPWTIAVGQVCIPAVAAGWVPWMVAAGWVPWVGNLSLRCAAATQSPWLQPSFLKSQATKNSTSTSLRKATTILGQPSSIFFLRFINILNNNQQ